MAKATAAIADAAITIASATPRPQPRRCVGTRRSSALTGSRTTWTTTVRVTRTTAAAAAATATTNPAPSSKRADPGRNTCRASHESPSEASAPARTPVSATGTSSPSSSAGGAAGTAPPEPGEGDLGAALLGRGAEHQPEDDQRQQPELHHQQRHDDVRLVAGAGHLLGDVGQPGERDRRRLLGQVAGGDLPLAQVRRQGRAEPEQLVHPDRRPVQREVQLDRRRQPHRRVRPGQGGRVGEEVVGLRLAGVRVRAARATTDQPSEPVVAALHAVHPDDAERRARRRVGVEGRVADPLDHRDPWCRPSSRSWRRRPR